jgi:proline iminopeptidase
MRLDPVPGVPSMKRLIIMLLAGLTMLAPHAGAMAQETPPEAVREGHIVTDDGVRLRYRMIGSGAHAVIVANTAAWLEDELATLAGNRTLVFFDARNRGGSDRVTDPQHLGMVREARDIDEIRRQLGFDRVALIGWSYVGALVTLYARDYPDHVSRLVLIGAMAPRAETMALGRGRGAGPDTAGVAHIGALRADALDRSNPTGFCREHVRLVDLPPRMGSHRAIEHYRSDPCRFENEWPANLSAAVGSVIASLGAWDWRQSVSDVQTPALVVHGTADAVPIEGAVEWVTALPDARLLRVAGAGHLPWLEAPDAVLGSIDTFLNGAWPATAEPWPGEATTLHAAGLKPEAVTGRPEQALEAFYDITADVAAVRAFHAAWVAAYTTGDLQRFMRQWSDGGIMMPPNAPALSAPDAVRAAAAELFADFDIAMQPTIEDVIVSGDWAIVRWRSSSALTPRAGGATTSGSGKAVWVLRREPGGAWRLVYDIWNSDGP